jgi:exopolysaccharide biosynthesis WecB/TagA/CpsF family protein/anti-anti-sigma factor
MAEKRRVAILGIPIDDLGEDGVVEEIRRFIKTFGEDGRSRQICTVNVDFVVNTLCWNLSEVRHPELQHILQTADLNTADGMPIVLMSRLLGMPLEERVTGADLVPRLAREGFALYFLGGMGDDGEVARRILAERYPATNVVAVDSPFVHTVGEKLADHEAEDAAIIERINAARPEILLLALGNPKQELWFNRNREKLKVPVTIGVGGTFSFIAGTTKRAPLWMQKTGLEWIFRLAVDPRRLFKRYFVGFFKFGFMVLPSLLFHLTRLRRSSAAGVRAVAGAGEAAVVPGDRVLRPEGRLDAETAPAFTVRGEELLAGGDLLVDLGAVTVLDSTGLGALLSLRRKALQEERTLQLANLPEPVRRLMELTRTWKVFEGMTLETAPDRPATEPSTVSRFGLDIDVQQSDEVTVLVLSGRLDQRSTERLELEQFPLEAVGRGLLVDGSGLEFLDSVGIRFLLKLVKRMDREEKPLAVCGLNPEVARVLQITRVDTLIATAANREEGLRLLHRREPQKV